MSKKHYMPVFTGDLLRDTMHLTVEQFGAYNFLLYSLWNNGGSLKSDIQYLSRVCRVSKTIFKNRIWPDIADFFTVENGRLSNARLTEELKKTEEKIAKKAKGGRAYSPKKGRKNNKTSGTPVQQSLNDPNQGFGLVTNVTKNQTPTNTFADPPLREAVDELLRHCQTKHAELQVSRLSESLTRCEGSTLFVNGRYAFATFSDTLKFQLRDAGLSLALADQNVIQLKTKAAAS